MRSRIVLVLCIGVALCVVAWAMYLGLGAAGKTVYCVVLESSLRSSGAETYDALVVTETSERHRWLSFKGIRQGHSVVRKQIAAVSWSYPSMKMGRYSPALLEVQSNAQETELLPVGNGQNLIITDTNDPMDGTSTLALWKREGEKFIKVKESRLRKVWCHSRNGEWMLVGNSDRITLLECRSLKEVTSSDELQALSSIFVGFDRISGGAFLTSGGRDVIRVKQQGKQCTVSLVDRVSGSVSQLTLGKMPDSSIRVLDCERIGDDVLFLVSEISGSFPNEKNAVYIVDRTSSIVQTLEVNVPVSAVDDFRWDPENQRILLFGDSLTGSGTLGLPPLWIFDYKAGKETSLQPELPKGFVPKPRDLTGK